MGKFALDDVRVYAAAEEFADLIWTVVSNWDRFARNTLGGQIVRAADSIGANIAEGFGRASPADHQRFVRTARGSLYEVRHFLRRADKRGLLPPADRAQLKQMLHALMPSLNAYLRSIARHASGK